MLKPYYVLCISLFRVSDCFILNCIIDLFLGFDTIYLQATLCRVWVLVRSLWMLSIMDVGYGRGAVKVDVRVCIILCYDLVITGIKVVCYVWYWKLGMLSLLRVHQFYIWFAAIIVDLLGLSWCMYALSLVVMVVWYYILVARVFLILCSVLYDLGLHWYVRIFGG